MSSADGCVVWYVLLLLLTACRPGSSGEGQVSHLTTAHAQTGRCHGIQIWILAPHDTFSAPVTAIWSEVAASLTKHYECSGSLATDNSSASVYVIGTNDTMWPSIALDSCAVVLLPREYKFVNRIPIPCKVLVTDGVQVDNALQHRTVDLSLFLESNDPVRLVEDLLLSLIDEYWTLRDISLDQRLRRFATNCVWSKEELFPTVDPVVAEGTLTKAMHWQLSLKFSVSGGTMHDQTLIVLKQATESLTVLVDSTGSLIVGLTPGFPTEKFNTQIVINKRYLLSMSHNISHVCVQLENETKCFPAAWINDCDNCSWLLNTSQSTPVYTTSLAKCTKIEVDAPTDSCQNRCFDGIPVDGSCYCDQYCNYLGDCCNDFSDLCSSSVGDDDDASTTQLPATCVDACDAVMDNSKRCFCDEACGRFNDCCADYAVACLRETEMVISTTVRATTTALKSFCQDEDRNCLFCSFSTDKCLICFNYFFLLDGRCVDSCPFTRQHSAPSFYGSICGARSPTSEPSGYEMVFEGPSWSSSERGRRFSSSFEKDSQIISEVQLVPSDCSMECSRSSECLGFFSWIKGYTGRSWCVTLRHLGIEEGARTALFGFSYRKVLTEVVCTESCRTCQLSGCQECRLPYILHDGKCVRFCPATHHVTLKSPRSLTCSLRLVPPPTSLGITLPRRRFIPPPNTCFEGKFFNGSSCKCSPHCYSCEFSAFGSVCLVCSYDYYNFQGRCYDHCGYFPLTFGFGNGRFGRKCVSKDSVQTTCHAGVSLERQRCSCNLEGCLACNVELGVCLHCQSGMSLLAGGCVSSCPVNMVQVVTEEKAICQAQVCQGCVCPDHCQSCMSQHFCTQCESDYSLFQVECPHEASV